jgi:Carboxypeptidase regulatory-like domain
MSRSGTPKCVWNRLQATARRFSLQTTLQFGASILFAAACYGQQLTATISSTTYDQSGAIVPNAQVTVKNANSGDTRQTVSNNSGYFTVTALQPGMYDIQITASGFKSWQQKGLVLNQGDNRTLPNISLEIGAATQQVEVTAGAESVAPVDTGEISTTLNQHMVNDITLQGRNAGELMKIMPGMAFSSGLNNGNGGSGNAGFAGRTVGTNTGPIGNFSANGTQPNGAMSYLLDGANLVDPGNQGTQIANINGDMTAEVKFLSSGYDAQYAKGPIIFQAISKSGSQKFHGEGYLYARNSVFNSNDSYFKSNGLSKPDEHEYYPGGNIGGPVLLPFTHFNRNRDKLFFWFGYEYMNQHPAGSLWQTFVPTTEMRNGNFSPEYLASLPASVRSQYPNITAAPCPAGTGGLSSRSSCGNLVFPTGQIPTSLFDPNALALLKTYPMPNQDPGAHGGNNFSYLDQNPVNRWEQTEKVDYSISDNTKLTVSFTHQSETDYHPVQVWWAPSWSLPYPSPLVAPTKANVVMANATHVFSPSLTNETVFTYARYINPITPQNPTAIDPATYGFNVPGLFGAKRTQIPNLISWGGNGGFAGYDTQAIFGGGFNGGAFGGLKSVPAIYDNLSKVAGTHTMKFGFYWDSNGNVGSSGQPFNGTYDFETYGNTSTGNLYADLLTGRAASYSQASAIPVDKLTYHQWSVYGQDSWKVSKRLTVNYGVRLDHIGQWYDSYGGVAVFNPAAYAADPTAVNAGLQWNAKDGIIPQSGWKSPWFYFDPRVGLAYDIFGNGRTVLRAGFGVFRYQISNNTVTGPAELSLGVANATVPNGNGLTSLAGITAFNPSSTANAACGSNCAISALLMGDGKTPYTEDYNVSISQALPWRSLFEVSYVGNRSRDLLTAGTNSDSTNLNMPQMGAFFGPDPLTGQINNPAVSGFPSNDYRPYQSYGDMWIASHQAYSNYNSLQASWQKQSGPLTFVANYTFSKVLGIRDGVSQNGASAGNMVDPLNLKANYGVLAFDHTHIFNTAYVWSMPSPLHGNKLLSGAVNGWKLSGVVQLQSGAPLQPSTNGSLNASYGNVNFGTAANPNYAGVGPSTWLGTNATGLVLEPVLTCDPRKGLKSGQYFNPGCFAPPVPGQQGDIIWPYIKGPKYFDTDLAIYKSFSITESQKVELRFSASNFLNHPNAAFSQNGNSDVALTFVTPNSPNNVLSQTNQNTTTSGYPRYTVGNRLIQFALKYYF